MVDNVEPDLYLTFYARPNGERHKTLIVDITPEDKTFFLTNNVKLSAEDDTIGRGYILYADYGATLPGDEDTPDEVIVISSPDERCKDAMRRLRQEVMKRYEKRNTNVTTL